MITDTHCHLTNEFFDNIDEIINNANNNGVTKVISDADNISSCYEMIELSKKYDNVFVTLGIHPESCDEDFNELKKIVEENENNRKVIAIGEIGLDYYYTKENKDKQIELFENQLELAEKYNLPVVVHSREATLDTINILKKHKVRGVIHCFSGSYETAMEYIKMGLYIGVGGVLTFKNAKIGEVIKRLPIDKLLFETDAPFLAPVPYRGKRNEPAYVKSTMEYYCTLVDKSIDEVMPIIENNVSTLFNI